LCSDEFDECGDAVVEHLECEVDEVEVRVVCVLCPQRPAPLDRIVDLFADVCFFEVGDLFFSERAGDFVEDVFDPFDCLAFVWFCAFVVEPEFGGDLVQGVGVVCE